jgi:hypothetical protein
MAIRQVMIKNEPGLCRPLAPTLLALGFLFEILRSHDGVDVFFFVYTRFERPSFQQRLFATTLVILVMR